MWDKIPFLSFSKNPTSWEAWSRRPSQAKPGQDRAGSTLFRLMRCLAMIDPSAPVLSSGCNEGSTGHVFDQPASRVPCRVSGRRGIASAPAGRHPRHLGLRGRPRGRRQQRRGVPAQAQEHPGDVADRRRPGAAAGAGDPGGVAAPEARRRPAAAAGDGRRRRRRVVRGDRHGLRARSPAVRRSAIAGIPTCLVESPGRRATSAT